MISTTRLAARLGLCSLVATLSLSVACDDGSDDAADSETGETMAAGDGDGDGDSGALSYAADIQPIWDDNCVTGCHEPSGLAEFLDLTADSYDDVVGTLSTQATSKQLIEAGNAADSYLIAKLRGTQMEAGGNGGSMPGGVNPIPLPEATITMIEQWANEGALP